MAADRGGLEGGEIRSPQRLGERTRVFGVDQHPGDAVEDGLADAATLIATTGRPDAWASTGAIPNSSMLGTTKARQPA